MPENAYPQCFFYVGGVIFFLHKFIIHKEKHMTLFLLKILAILRYSIIHYMLVNTIDKLKIKND